MLLTFLLLASAAARELSPTPVMKLRGGGKNEIILGVSAATAIANGALVAVGKSDTANLLGFGLVEVIDDPRYGIAVLGWGMGKLAALMAGGDAIPAYLKLNLIPMALWLVTNAINGAAMKEYVMPLVFGALYSWVVFG